MRVRPLPQERDDRGLGQVEERARRDAELHHAPQGDHQGQRGDDAEAGGFDAVSFWARGGVSYVLTPEDAAMPTPQRPAQGDIPSGGFFAGGICAALVKRAMTGEASEVDVSLLGTAMWSMQRYICQATADNVDRFPRPEPGKPHNVLVSNYRTSDGRFLALCMLQADKYWAPLCEVAGRPDLAADPRFADANARRENLDACYAELKALFGSRTLAEWREILARQAGMLSKQMSRRPAI